MARSDLLPEIESPAGSRRGFTVSQWLVLIASLLGWMFDGVEMGLFPVVASPALQDLLGKPAKDPVVDQWISYLAAAFLLGAALGGLAFGWLGDRIGRVRAMGLSILAYSLFTGACYFAIAPWQLAVLRFFGALGMGGQWALGVALVVECWPERLRPLLSGIVGSTGNVGYLLVGLITMKFAVTADAWRWTMLACASPAVLALLIVAFVPESKRWQQAAQGPKTHPLRELFGPRLRRSTLLAICFSSVALIGTWACVQTFLPAWAEKLVGKADPIAKSWTQTALACGAIVGCLVAPLIGGRIGRRPAYFGICLLSLAACWFLFHEVTEYGTLFLLTTGVTGCFTASFYGWLPLYLPELFPTRVRATGQGLSYNFGRILAMVGVLTTGGLMNLFDGDYPRACSTISLIYVFGMVLIWFGPETKGKPLPD